MSNQNLFFNPDQIAIEEQTYYSVQHGLILTVAYYSNETWFITGFGSVKANNFKEEFYVVQKLFTHNQLVAGVTVTV